MADSGASRRIAVALHDLRGGGAERVSLNLVKGMVAAGRQVDLVLVKAEGAYIDQIPQGVRVITLDKRNVFKAIPALVRYMKAERPAGLVSSLTHVNIAVLIAKLIARVDTRVLVSEHNQISRKARVAKGPRGWLTYRAVPLLYRRADVIVAVSQGVADDLADFAGLPQGRVECIYNPVYDETLVAAAAQPVDHPWMAPGQPPVIVAAGRLQEQKGFDVLLRAFQAVRRVRDVRLIIMGEGEDRAKLERLVAELGLGDSVSLIGFVENPYAMMARAQVFVLSSRWEGFSLVLVEAMACGAPIVSTDCPSGPREVLADGRYGKLVPIEDPVSLSEAIVQVLDDPGPSARDRAQSFTVRDAADAYLKALERS